MMPSFVNATNAKRLLAAAVAYKVLQGAMETKKKTVEGKLVLVTGAASGVGRGLALELARRGASLVLWDIQEEQLAKTRDLVLEATPTAAVQIDRVNLGDRDDVHAAAARVQGQVDVLINNAGLVSGNAYFTEVDIGRAELTMRVNLLAHMYTVREFLPSMVERDEGHIVSVTSIAAFGAASRMVDYAASKYGARGFAEGLSVELHERKSSVKVSCICPTHIDTALFKGFNHPMSPTLSVDQVVQGTIDAIEYERELVCLPDWLKYFTVLSKAVRETFMSELGTKLPFKSPMTGHNDDQAKAIAAAMKPGEQTSKM